MKTKLTPDQSQLLIERGINAKLASGEKVFVDIHPEVLKGNGEYAKPWGYIPIFTLSDILSLLPKRIDDLILSIFGTGLDELTEELKDGWMATYVSEFMESKGKDTIFQAPELIDALYELLCWVIQNHPDKIKKLG